MTKEEIVRHIKHIVVEQCGLDPEQRDWFTAFGKLIDKLEEDIKEESDIQRGWIELHQKEKGKDIEKNG